MTNDRAIPELSLDTQTLETLLSSTAIGDVVTYAQMSAAIGRDVQTVGRGHLRTARVRLHRAQQMVFAAVPNVGVKRMDDIGKIEIATGHTRRGRTQYKMAVRTVAAVDNFDALPNDQKIKHSMVAAQAGAILHMTSAVRSKKLAAAIGEHAQKSFKPRESLELMKASL